MFDYPAWAGPMTTLELVDRIARDEGATSNEAWRVQRLAAVEFMPGSFDGMRVMVRRLLETVRAEGAP